MRLSRSVLTAVIVNWRIVSGIILVGAPVIGIGLVIVIAAYSGCEIQDRPFRFLGDDCYKNGIYWNKIAAPVGIFSLIGIIIGPPIWVALLFSAKAIELVKKLLARRN